MIGNDIQKQIEIHNMRKTMYETEKDYLVKRMMQGPVGYKPVNMDGMPRGSSNDTSLEVSWEDMRRLQHMIELEQWAIDSLNKQCIEMKDRIKELKGIDSQVRYLRDFEGLRLKEIADILGYELGYIKNVSSRNGRA